MSEYGLTSKFDADKHKETFVNYLEVIISEDGSVEYAVPSHQDTLIRKACDKLGCTKEELYDMCPPEYYADFITWLCFISNSVSVWNNFCTYHTINIHQVATLRFLKLKGLYKGSIPKFKKRCRNVS